MKFQELLTIAKSKLENDTKLRAFSPGSIVRALLESYNLSAAEISMALDLKILNSYISTAAGDNLDKIGKLFNIERNKATYAVGSVKIYIDSSTGKTVEDLKDMIEKKTGERPGAIIIQAGTEISSEDGLIVFNTINDAILSDEPIFVDVISYKMGSIGNIASGVLKRINYSSLFLNVIKDYVLVTNVLPIDTGSDDEEDENYRFRIINAFNASANANEMSVRLAALSVPGVSDVIIDKYSRGIGTTSVFVISESPIVSQGILNAVEAAVSNVLSLGDKVIVSGPTYKAIAMTVVLQFKDTVGAMTKDVITKQVTENIITYINNIPVNGEFVANKCRDIIMDTSEEIYDYEIIKFGIGEYNVSSGLIDYFEPGFFTNHMSGKTEKFISNTKTINVCY